MIILNVEYKQAKKFTNSSYLKSKISSWTI